MQADTVGGITPAVLASLRPKEKILAAHGLMLYKEPQVKVGRRTMRQLGVSTGTYLSMRNKGDSEENFFFAEFEGPGHVAFSRDKGGEVRVRQLAQGETLRVRGGHLICFDEAVRYQPTVVAQWQGRDSNGNATTEYVFADALTGPGTIVFQAYGNILSFTLKPGETIRTSTEGFLAAQQTVGVQLQWTARGQLGLGAVPSPVPSGKQLLGFATSQLLGVGNVSPVAPAQGGNLGPVLHLTGPGTVMVHSGL